MANQAGRGGQDDKQQRGQENESGKQAGSTLPAGEKVGEWTEEEEEPGKKADPADAGSAGMNAPGPQGDKGAGNK